MLSHLIGALGYNVPVAGSSSSIVIAPYNVPASFDADIKEIKAGMYHSMALLTNGKVRHYDCGSN